MKNIIRKILNNIVWYINPSLFIKLRYFLKFWNFPDLKNPKTFNEKLQYIKLNWSKYIDLVDKYKVRNYIKEKIWEEVLTKLYWVWAQPEQIPFDDLPDKFVIKCNHWSGYNIIVDNKSKLDKNETIKQLKKWMNEDFWKLGAELQYANVEKMIVVEEFLKDDKYQVPLDYKFFCFNWVVDYIQVDFDRFSQHKRDFYSTKWDKLDFWLIYWWNDEKIDKPINLSKMIEYCEILSKGFPFVRIDFYEVKWKIYFWEITLTPEAWLWNFIPNHNEIDKKLWEKIDLKIK